MDLATVVGLAGCTIVILIVMVVSGSLMMYWDFLSLLIVLGGAAFSSMMRGPMKGVAGGIKAALIAITNQVQPPNELIDEIVELAEIARKQSILALEKVEVNNRILAKAVNYMVDGYDPEVIQDILVNEYVNMRQRHKNGRQLMDAMGETCPAFGMIGTVIGLIVIMANLSDPDKIGPGLAVALVTTLYGSLFSNVVFIPFGKKLEFCTQQESNNIKIIMEGTKTMLKGDSPKIIRERLQSFLEPEPGGGEDA